MQTREKERRCTERRVHADRRRPPLFGDAVERRQQQDRRKPTALLS